MTIGTASRLYFIRVERNKIGKILVKTVVKIANIAKIAKTVVKENQNHRSPTADQSRANCLFSLSAGTDLGEYLVLESTNRSHILHSVRITALSRKPLDRLPSVKSMYSKA